MKELVEKLVAGTLLPGVAQRVYRAVMRRPAPGAPAAAVDGNALYDAQTVAVMERVLERHSNCIDVGCHVGAILDQMLRLAPDGRHFAFEPLPDLYADLEREYAAAANVRLHEVALSDAAGEATFQHVVSNPGYSGLLKRRYDRPHEDVVEIRVERARLDDLLPPDVDIRLVKIDVEGAELHVLRGGLEMFRRFRPFVIFEHGLGAADCYGTRPEMVFDLFADCGLRLSLMGDWLSSHGRPALSRQDFMEEFDTMRNYYFLAHP